MGRHAGWIAAAGGLVADQGIPVVTLFPEVEFDQERFLAAVKAKVEQHGYCTICVSEGCHYPDGRFLAEQGTRDAFGHAQLGGAAPVVANMIKEALGYKFHWAVADYLQRAARHLASKTDVEQAYALGKAAVELAVAGHNSIMPTVVRKSAAPLRLGDRPARRCPRWPTSRSSCPRTSSPRTASASPTSAASTCYPLIQGEDYPPYENGLPEVRDAEEPSRCPRSCPPSS